MAKVKELKIKLVRSGIARNPNQVKTLKALGLTKINQVVTKPDNEAIRGMIATVSHLVEVL
ncbi:MAG TPA: 50S ribosomal protein L30 [Acholeplasmataceae bacterium]|jgi:large subunit ribosomal protein L30|nr:50S ribosomal protein L30 [Acholeplasmataceae bacterium]